MKNWKKFTALFAAALALCLFVSCSNSAGGGGSNTTPQETTPTSVPAPNPVIYTITFNANDGSAKPATDTQTFTAGTPQALKTIKELGFSKNGLCFAGWGTAADASQASYVDAASYTATSDATLYALWSEIPVCSVYTVSSESGTVTATPATGPAGTEITLSNSPSEGYKFAFYTVTTADGAVVTVTDGKFTMPAQDVTVTADFTAINFTVTVVTSENGSVSANTIMGESYPNHPKSVPVGAIVTLFNYPNDGFKLATLTVTAEDGSSVVLNETDGIYTKTFTMPAKNVTISATFVAIYSVNVGKMVKGSVTADKTRYIAQGEVVTLTINPAGGCYLETLSVSDSDGADVSVSGSDNSRTFVMPAKNVNVNATFAFFSSNFMTLGSWPQTIKAENVTVYESETKTVGIFTCNLGSDGDWYVKKNIGDNYFPKYEWFKVEPIKWRILTKDYNGTGKKLLLAENILIAKRYDARSSNYQNSEIRKWLNSNSSSASVSDHDDSGGFLKTAFAAGELTKIVDASVDNSVRSTLPDNYDSLSAFEQMHHWGSGENQNASDTPTTDKIFLLSVQEASKIEYGFDAYFTSDNGNDGSARMHQATDWVKANANGAGDYRWWWLRSPSGLSTSYTSTKGSAYVDKESYGVVPAMCIK